MESKEDELVMMVRTKDGKYRCVPVSKLKDFQKSEEKRLNNSYSEDDLKRIENMKRKMDEDLVTRRFKDFYKNELYTPEIDTIVYDIINTGHCSSAHVQRVLNCGYAKAMRVIDMLVECGIISDGELHYKCLITKEFFDILIEKRKENLC